jgi:hypothetical protein
MVHVGICKAKSNNIVMLLVYCKGQSAGSGVMQTEGRSVGRVAEAGTRNRFYVVWYVQVNCLERYVESEI